MVLRRASPLRRVFGTGSRRVSGDAGRSENLGLYSPCAGLQPAHGESDTLREIEMSTCRIIVCCVLVAALCSCSQDSAKQGPWLPVLEPASFNYLEDAVERGVQEIDQAAEELAAGRCEDARGRVLAGRRVLRELGYYFVPMTQVRQLVFDADRFYGLNRFDVAKKNLLQAREVLARIADSGGRPLQKKVVEVEVKIDQLLENIARESSDKVPELFEALGHEVNMLAIKGDLVLTGVHFPGEQ